MKVMKYLNPLQVTAWTSQTSEKTCPRTLSEWVWVSEGIGLQWCDEDSHSEQWVSPSIVFLPIASMPFTILLLIIFRIESINMWPSLVCQTSSDLLTIIDHAMLVEDDGSRLEGGNEMNACSLAVIMARSWYRPSLRWVMAINYLTHWISGSLN